MMLGNGPETVGRIGAGGGSTVSGMSGSNAPGWPEARDDPGISKKSFGDLVAASGASSSSTALGASGRRAGAGRSAMGVGGGRGGGGGSEKGSSQERPATGADAGA